MAKPRISTDQQEELRSSASGPVNALEPPQRRGRPLMPSRQICFRQRDLAAALKAMAAAGIEVRAVEIDPIASKIVILTIASSAKEPTNDLDKWLAQHARQA
jgi:hypothetical protein